MSVSWFRKEFLVPRRLVFNVVFYGVQVALFALGWYLQVRAHLTLIFFFFFHLVRRQPIRGWPLSTSCNTQFGFLGAQA